MRKPDDVGATIANLLATQVQCVLATVDGDRPEQHLMAYAYSDDLERIYIASRAQTGKVQNMTRNASVALFWDNRTGNTQDHTDGLALHAGGNAQRTGAGDIPAARSALLSRNPSIQKLLDDTDVAIFSIRIEQYKLVAGYDAVFLFEPGPH